MCINFFVFLKKKQGTQEDDAKEVRKEQFRAAVKKSKRRSTSSALSNRDRYVRKCTTNFKIMAKVLVRCYNVKLECNHFPSR